MVCTRVLADLPSFTDIPLKNSLFNSALKQSTAVRRDLDTFAQAPGSGSPALQGELLVC